MRLSLPGVILPFVSEGSSFVPVGTWECSGVVGTDFLSRMRQMKSLLMQKYFLASAQFMPEMCGKQIEVLMLGFLFFFFIRILIVLMMPKEFLPK